MTLKSRIAQDNLDYKKFSKKDLENVLMLIKKEKAPKGYWAHCRLVEDYGFYCERGCRHTKITKKFYNDFRAEAEKEIDRSIDETIIFNPLNA